ncbi:MAG: DUF349 domain-containing protein [Gammaproteobacteria bacterium]|nr:DUF349 domain-containing protein [Gammaproteobacteria bacterium]MDH3767121.1 DUF349 domain-containing protein [Gammaproteobacteria bacterium]
MWFKSKLQHPDPEIRREHLEHLAPEDALLLEIAQSDPHPDVRAAALMRIIDLPTLEELSNSDNEERVRNLAVSRLQALISGREDPSPALDTRLAFFGESADDRLARFVARSAREPELRKIAVTKLLKRQNVPDVQDLLCEIAADDSVSEIRETAAAPIHDIERLQTLFEKTRGRDKSIHRLARERLEALQTQWDARENLDKCCIDAEQLAASHFSADGKIEEGRWSKLAGQWDQYAVLVEAPDESLTKRYAAAKQVVEKKQLEIRQQQERRAEILAALQSHLTDTDVEPVSTLTRKWHELDEPVPAQAREFSKLVAEITKHDSQRERDEHRVVAKRAILQKFEDEIAVDTLRKGALSRFEKRWEAAPDPVEEGAKKELHEAFATLREKTRLKLEKQTQRLDERIEQAKQLLDQYGSALDDGKLRVATSAHDKVASLLGRLDAPEKIKRDLQQRLRAGEAKMAELKKWRHWGTERKREELCERAAALSTSDMKIPAVAKAVRECRDAWKALDRSDGPGAKKHWQRFDAACEKAYEPCQAFFNEQKEKRQENMKARVQICERLETCVAETDWEAPPWRDLADFLKDVQDKWRVAGSVDRREKNKIQKRFDQAYGGINEHMGVMRKQEIERREGLIASVKAVAEGEDVRQAVEKAKQAQREWKPVVQAGRRKEQELWTRFREVCDAVFERRKEHFAAADNERTQNLGEKMAVCGQLDEMLASISKQLEAGSGDKEFILEMRKKARELNSGWRRIGPVPRGKRDSVDKQFNTSHKKLDKLCRRFDKNLERQAMQGMRDAASCCDELELSVAAGNNIDAEAVEQAQAKLGSVSADNPVLKRLQRLKEVVDGNSQATTAISEALPANLGIKRNLCLELEIAANIDSPAECQEERMQYRVAQLSESMSGTRKQLGPDELERVWYETGPVPKQEQTALQNRFSRALEALSKD